MINIFANLLGKLNSQALPHDPVTAGAAASIVLGGLMAVLALTYFKKWRWLWREWLTTTNHKRIGIMYIILAVLMLLRGISDAVMIRIQQSTSVGTHNGPFKPDMIQQVFSAHGTIMIFFVAMGVMF